MVFYDLITIITYLLLINSILESIVYEGPP